MGYRAAATGILVSLSAAKAGLASALRQQTTGMVMRCASTAPVLCGEYDRKTFKGKRFAGTYGLSRRRGNSKPQTRTPSWHTPPPAWRSPRGLPPYSLQQQGLTPTQQAAGSSWHPLVA